jgi:aspartate-semialdehyde dehydrogenase
VLSVQRERRGWPGGIVTNANCAATVAALAMAPLEAAFGIERAFVVTMQAVSGAGYPGVASLDILGNVIPHIANEEPKIEQELPKLFGRFEAGALVPAPLRVSAQANRVAVEHGHTVCLSLGFGRRVTAEACVAAFLAWSAPAEIRDLPSAPARAVVLASGADRPQPRRDVMTGGGMSVLVGRIRSDPLLDVRLVALGHNTIRGAAGGSLLNAELLAARGRLPV